MIKPKVGIKILLIISYASVLLCQNPCLLTFCSSGKIDPYSPFKDSILIWIIRRDKRYVEK